MADGPILFSAPMVAALLADRKTQTRRVLANPEFYGCPTGDCPHQTQAECNAAMASLGPDAIRYAIGDRLYVREAYYQQGHWEPVPGARTKGNRQKWAFVPTGPISFDAPDEFRKGRHSADPATVAWHKRLGRFMPRWASRLTLTVTDVRVERLQEISETDAIAEGIEHLGRDPMLWRNYSFASNLRGTSCPVTSYRTLWNSINSPGAWEANPWVVAVSFITEQRNIDAGDA
ncbi:MAG: hypothetical protein KGJ57_17680 [Sphingomonadales bacterium]|nr:hypothetical protein [Sphingomonadales bacterium]MDE2171230.1 hypothetical protein [Sphingomonadales bacterium]